GRDGSKQAVGEANPQQLDAYKAHDCHWEVKIPASARYYKMANRDYLAWAKSLGFLISTDAIVLELYSERLQRFRLAAQGHGAMQPPARERARVEKFFDPLPFWYPAEALSSDAGQALSPDELHVGGEGWVRGAIDLVQSPQKAQSAPS